MEHLLKSATSADYEGAGPYAGEGANVCVSVVSSISGGCSGRDVATIVDITACSGDVQFRWAQWVHAGQEAWPLSFFLLPTATCAAGNWFAQRSAAQRVDLITSVLGRARTSVLNLAAVCYRTVQPRGRFNLLWFWRRAASVLNHIAVCYPQDCSAQGSLPFTVVAVGRFMGIMACSAGRRLA